jgi:ABC-2 type transport system ATP-binding protein
MEHVEELCRNICILHRSNTVLKGSVKEIKKQFPKERVMLATEQEVQGLEQIPGVRSVKRHENAYELHIADPSVAQRILQEAMAQTVVHRFELMEPTLNEIFIKAVGGEDIA